MNSINKKKKGALGVVWSETELLSTRLFNNASTVLATGVYTTDLFPNSAFNPLGSLSAVQPARYDQFDAMYRKCVVKKAKYHLTFAMASSAATNLAFVVAVYPIVSAAAPAAPATYQAAASIPGAKVTEWSPGSKSVSLDFDMDIANVLGHPLTSDTYGLGASPVTQVRLGVFIQASNGGTVHQITWVIDALQWTTFSERKFVVDA